MRRLKKFPGPLSEWPGLILFIKSLFFNNLQEFFTRCIFSNLSNNPVNLSIFIELSGISGQGLWNGRTMRTIATDERAVASRAFPKENRAPLMPTSRFMLSPPRIDGNALFSGASFFRSSRVQEPARTASIPKPEKCATAANAGKCRFREEPGRPGTDEPGARSEGRSDPERRSFAKNSEAAAAALHTCFCAGCGLSPRHSVAYENITREPAEPSRRPARTPRPAIAPSPRASHAAWIFCE